MPRGLNIPAGTVALEVAAELDKFERQMKKDVPKAAGQAGEVAGREFERSFSRPAGSIPRERRDGPAGDRRLGHGWRADEPRCRNPFDSSTYANGSDLAWES